MRNGWRALAVAILILLFVCNGCNNDQRTAREKLEDGEVAIGGMRYDVAVSDADDVIRLKPSPTAYYLRARAEEDRPKPDNNITAADLAKAKADYQSALDLHPAPDLAARCKAGLANVAFDLNDYATAIPLWQSAVNDLEAPEWRALALYHIGIAQQRLGHFQDADKTFHDLIDQYADQEIATRAQSRIGIHGYYVQIGAFNDLPAAQTAMDKAQSAGVPCRESADQGLIAVRTPLFPTYAKAQSTEATLATQFPTAAIGP